MRGAQPQVLSFCSLAESNPMEDEGWSAEVADVSVLRTTTLP